MTNGEVFCQDCGLLLADAGAGIGLYCQNYECPGIAKSQQWAERQIHDAVIKNALKVMHDNGFIVVGHLSPTQHGHIHEWTDHAYCIVCGIEYGVAHEPAASPFSEFIRNATPEQRAEVYGRAMDKASELQREIVTRAMEREAVRVDGLVTQIVTRCPDCGREPWEHSPVEDIPCGGTPVKSGESS